jgi:hypothetical protein
MGYFSIATKAPLMCSLGCYGWTTGVLLVTCISTTFTADYFVQKEPLDFYCSPTDQPRSPMQLDSIAQLTLTHPEV